jgi:uncharacterized protein (UPF0371 family)
MLNKIGFDNEKYIEEQTSAILERVNNSSKLYLEFGGKILFDYHAARVLPGFDPNVKMRLLQQLKDKSDMILCIYAGDIAKRKVRADFGITYDSDALKMIDDLNEWGIGVLAVVVTRFDNQPASIAFVNKLERRNIKVYTHKFTKGYPTDVDTVVSEEGYGANEYIESKNPIVIVTGPGPGSGKLATCLSQLYHESRRGIIAKYAKFETFPIWNLPIKHPVNVAYEAATAELKDVNLIDNFHLETYNQIAVNYNRDIEAFPLLKRIVEKITKVSSFYKSPTDMGVNRAGFSIIDDDVVREAAIQEIIRRYFRYACEYAMGLVEKETVQRIELLMEDLNVKIDDRKVVIPARKAALDTQRRGKGNKGIYCGAAIELKDGTIITGGNSLLMHSASSLILNATKHLAKIPRDIDLLPLSIIESLNKFKKDILKGKMASLDLGETLIVLSISAATNPLAQIAVEKLKELDGCEVHMTHIPTPGDAAGLRKIGVNLTSDPDFYTNNLFIS